MKQTTKLRDTFHAPDGDGPEPKRGVAIVIILGLLAVLMLAASAFSIAMRVEREASATFRHNIKARHLLSTALANAINDINRSLDYGTNSSAYFLYPANWYSATGAGGVMASSGSGVANLLSRTGREFIPDSLYTAFMSTNASWRTIITNNEVQGRYAYKALDCSGLLDANMVGGATRAHGGDPHEIQIGALPEVLNTNDFISRRNELVRFETFPELAYLHDKGLYADPTSVNPTFPANFAVYSLSPVGERLMTNDATGANKINISGGTNELLANRNAIVQGIKGSLECSESDANFVFTNLLDYIDDNSVPAALNAPYTEKVPMISEFFIRNTLSSPGTNGMCRAWLRLDMEFHYPFVEPSLNSNKFDAFTEWKVMAMNTNSGYQTNFVINTTNDCGYSTGDREIFIEKIPWAAPNVWIPATNAQQVRFEFQIRAFVTDPGGSVVDAAPFPTNLYIGSTSNLTITHTVADTNTYGYCGVECTDPRFNWVDGGNGWRQTGKDSVWLTAANGATNSLGTTNYWTMVLYSNDVLGASDRGMSMHVSDRGSLLSVGELGNLIRGTKSGSMLRTIRLFKPAGGFKRDTVFERFTLANGMRRGLVNLNNVNVEVLKAVFTNAPLWYPDSTARLSGAVTNIANAITNAVLSTNATIRQVFYDVGDIGNLDWRSILPDLNGFNDLQRESVISYSAGLLTVRQNLFTILLVAESYKSGMAGGPGSTLAATRAVAEVWRDPFPLWDAAGEPVMDASSNRLHRCLVRYFRVLDD